MLRNLRCFPELPRHVIRHRPDLHHGPLKFVGADAEFLSPMPAFVILIHVDALALGTAAVGSVVCDNSFLVVPIGNNEGRQSFLRRSPGFLMRDRTVLALSK